MRRIIAMFLILLLCAGFIGAAPRQEAAGPAASQTDVSLASLKRNGTEVTSASSLSLYDVVTFGKYPQSAYGQSADRIADAPVLSDHQVKSLVSCHLTPY